MKKKTNNWFAQTYIAPRIEIIVLQNEQPLLTGSGGKNPGIKPGFGGGKEEEEDLEIP